MSISEDGRSKKPPYLRDDKGKRYKPDLIKSRENETRTKSYHRLTYSKSSGTGRRIIQEHVEQFDWIPYCRAIDCIGGGADNDTDEADNRKPKRHRK